MRKATNSAVRRVAELPIAIASDVGLVRSENQDRAAILRIQLTENRSSIVVVLCDGMGGMSDGAECASLAIATFLSSCVQNANLSLHERVVSSVKNANDAIFTKYIGRGGATLSAFIADSQDGILGVNVGDSRIYSIVNDKLSQITVDDTIAGQFPQENENILGRNDLLQYVGMGQGIEPHIVAFPNYSAPSSILLTSDGMHFLDKQTMASVIKNASDSGLAIRRLIELAKWCGGHDNASGIIVTNISSLLMPNASTNFGNIEVWDAFGEIQLINQNFLVASFKPESKVEVKVTIDKKTKPMSKRAPINKGTLVGKKVIPSKKRSVKNADSDKPKEKKPVPQLQIDFDVH
jgi:serine/threonine protein phosphatase PrpC